MKSLPIKVLIYSNKNNDNDKDKDKDNDNDNDNVRYLQSTLDIYIDLVSRL